MYPNEKKSIYRDILKFNKPKLDTMKYDEWEDGEKLTRKLSDRSNWYCFSLEVMY
jgi:hypothetical protein